MTESSEWHDYDCGPGLNYPHSNLRHHYDASGTITPPSPGSVSFPGIGTQEGALDTGTYGYPDRDRHGNWVPPAPRAELIWAAIDLDGTLAHGVWTPESNGRDIGDPIERNVWKLEELRWDGYKIVIHTARGWEHYESIESWLNYWGIQFDRIVCGKLLAAVYVDDRAVESEEESWLPVAQKARQTVKANGRQ